MEIFRYFYLKTNLPNGLGLPRPSTRILLASLHKKFFAAFFPAVLYYSVKRSSFHTHTHKNQVYATQNRSTTQPWHQNTPWWYAARTFSSGISGIAFPEAEGRSFERLKTERQVAPVLRPEVSGETKILTPIFPLRHKINYYFERPSSRDECELPSGRWRPAGIPALPWRPACVAGPSTCTGRDCKRFTPLYVIEFTVIDCWNTNHLLRFVS